MKKYYLFIIPIIMILSACGQQPVSDEVIQAAIRETNIALTPTKSKDQITDAMIQTAIAETQTANPTQLTELSSTPSNTQTPDLTFAQTEIVGEDSQNSTNENLVGYSGDYLHNKEIGFRVSTIEFPVDYDLVNLSDGEVVLKFEAEFLSLSINILKDDYTKIDFTKIYVFDDDGYKYEIDKSTIFGSNMQLLPNEKVKSDFYVALPNDVNPSIIKYEDRHNSDIQVNLKQPPQGYALKEIDQAFIPSALKLGSIAEADGYKAFAISIDDPYTEASSEDGYKLIRVEMSFENVSSNETLDVDNHSDIYLVDTKGYVYPQIWPIAIIRDGVTQTDIGKGERIEGYYFFEIYENSVPNYIRYGNLKFGLN